MTDLERLKLNAENGRGLWIGLMADRSPQHELIKLAIDEKNPDVAKQVDGAHVTLAHFGKSNDARSVVAVVTACEQMPVRWCEMVTSVEGLARFTNHVVALMSPNPIDNLCGSLWTILEREHVYPDSSFAGVRHVTMNVIKRGTEDVVVPKIPKYSLTFRTVAVVCGDATISFTLPPVTDVF